MRYNKNRLFVGSLSIVMLPVVLMKPVMAEEQFTNTLLEEVVVTARKRKESLQDTPVAVSAFNQRSLRQLGVSNVQDLDGFVPGLHLTGGTGTAKTAQAFMRGVGRREAMTSNDAAILTYVDGIYQWRPEAALMDTLDVENVEVLRGPQGTLFGKNTTAGAILITSQKPSDELYSTIAIKVGNYSLVDVKLAANAPLAENVFSKFTLSSKQRDGYVDNTVTGRALDDADRIQGAAQLRWLLSDSITWDLSVGLSKRQESGRVGRCTFAGFEYVQAAPLVDILSATDFESQCKAASSLESHNVTVNYEPIFEVDSRNISSNWLWDLDVFAGLEDASLKITTGWISVNSNYLDGDQDGTALSVLHTLNQDQFSSTQFTQELQLNGTAFDGSLRLVTGLFGTYEKLVDDLAEANIAGGTIRQPKNQDIRNWSYAVFSQVSYDLSETWELTGGLRYTEEQRAIDALSGLNFAGVELGPLYDSKKERFESVTPMINLRWNGDDLISESENLDSLMAYATYSEGFKAGGYSLFDVYSIESYDPEEVSTFELGLKLDGLGNRLRFNAAVYYSDYTDMQLLVFELPPGGFITNVVTRNAGEATIQGFEAELTYFPWRGLMVMGSLAYTDAQYDEFIGNRTIDGVVQPVDRSVESFNQTPEWTGFLALQYMFTLSSGHLTPRLEASYKDEVAYHMDHGTWLAGIANQESVTLFNASLSWESADERTRLSLFGRNITDEEYFDGLAGSADGIGAVILMDGTPRTYGLELNYRFGG